MVTGTEHEPPNEDERNPIISLLLAVRRSFIAFIIALGVVCLLLATVLSTNVPGFSSGVLSAMFAVWGVSAFVYAGFGYVGLRFIGYR